MENILGISIFKARLVDYSNTHTEQLRQTCLTFCWCFSSERPKNGQCPCLLSLMMSDVILATPSFSCRSTTEWPIIYSAAKTQKSHLFRVQWSFWPIRTILSQLISHTMCEFINLKLQSPKCPLLYHFLNWALAGKPALCWWSWSPLSTISTVAGAFNVAASAVAFIVADAAGAAEYAAARD